MRVVVAKHGTDPCPTDIRGELRDCAIAACEASRAIIAEGIVPLVIFATGTQRDKVDFFHYLADWAKEHSNEKHLRDDLALWQPKPGVARALTNGWRFWIGEAMQRPCRPDEKPDDIVLGQPVRRARNGLHAFEIDYAQTPSNGGDQCSKPSAA